jgi:hypothetical protein
MADTRRGEEECRKDTNHEATQYKHNARSRRQGTYVHSNLPLYFSKAVNDAERCKRVIPG